MEIVTPVQDIETGDQFIAEGRVVWTALEDAGLVPAEEPTDYGPEWARVLVRFELDGGTDYRTWDDPTLELNVRRAS